MKTKLTILFLYLILAAFAQDECQESRMNLIQTGQIVLNPNDLANTGVSKNYYEPLSRGNFGAGDFLGFAVAIAGFQTACSQTFYSLVVDLVQFQASNSQMKLTIDFQNTAKSNLTTWTKVKLTYLVVSAQKLEVASTGSKIWATSALVDLTAGPINNNFIFSDDIFQGTPAVQTAADCGLTYTVAQGFIFNTACDGLPATNWANDVAIHTYIMGFRYQPDTAATNQFLGASVKYGTAVDGTHKEVVYVSTSERGAAPYLNTVFNVQLVYSAAIGARNNGPKLTISNFNGQLKSIKVAIVLTVINPVAGTSQARNGFESTFSFSYSGLFKTILPADYNLKVLIDDNDVVNSNNLHQMLPVPKYKIYGFSEFAINDNSGCSSINFDINIDTSNSYTTSVNNKDFVHDVTVSADIYFKSMSATCSPIAPFRNLYRNFAATPKRPIGETVQLGAARAGSNSNLKQMKTRLGQKYSTIPSNSIYQYIQQISDNPLDLKFTVVGIKDDTTNVQLKAQVNISGINDGKPYGLRILMLPTSTQNNPSANTYRAPALGLNYQFNVKVNGLNTIDLKLSEVQLNAASQPVTNAAKLQFHYGLNLKGASAVFDYSLVIPRDSVDGILYQFEFFVDFFEFVEVYDPVTQCCVSKCPATNGLNIDVTPPICVVCDVAKGLSYNPSTGSCKCAQTFYLSSLLNFQCFPCQTKLCSVCDPTTTTKCITCLTGATLNIIDNTCSCSSGFYQNNGTCSNCPAKCTTCKTNTTCDTCADVNRNLNNNCGCIAGFYDAGVDKCVSCSPSCATCENSTTCLTCDARKFRTIKGSICVCQDGFFELIFENGTKVCKPCSAQCRTCSQSAIECTSCDSTINRIQGYDSLGHRTCICKSGYHSLNDSSCIQSNCKSDTFCSQCETNLALCIQCRASINRVIKLPEHICVCADGYFEDNNKTCQQCASGCAKCNSSKLCNTCVAQASNNGDGTCSCAVGTFFTKSTNGVRFCQKCIQYCDKCSNGLTCQTCKTGFVLSTDNTCICPKNNFINPNGDCVPCKSGCETCTTTANCNKCISPLVVQENVCVTKCSAGYYLSGATCIGCPSNCVGCTSTNQCYYCKDGFYLHEGACYTACPSGTVANRDSFQCVACNTPCRTCTNHPSTCTSCQPGEGYLQVNGATQLCVKNCAEGTFPKGNVCEVCDFRCAKCLGAANNCIACPVGRYLYNGACWDYCPGVMVNNKCTNTCPAGYFRLSDQECKPCSSECATCDNNSTCLTCANNFVSKIGKCVQSCGDGFYEFRGICVACDKTCKSCKTIPTLCVDCADGYIRSGSQCVSTCAQGSFLDGASKSCRACSSTCKTCASENYCLSCPNANILPVGGQCLSCIYPCDTCSADLSVCNSCLSGFYLSGGQCVKSCPSGTRPVNGVCACSSGIFLDGTCVEKCPSGYTKVGSGCARCQSPCVQCSGSSKFCTDCLDSYTLSPNTGACQQNSACNYGQQVLNGKCERICDEGSYYQNGACIFGGCPDSFKDNGFGGCVSATVNTNRCQIPTFKLNGACVDKCGNGFFPNSNTRTCDACSTSCQFCLDKSYCIGCASGFTSQEGKCVAQSNCKATEFLYGTACVASCPNGAFTNSGRCIRSCPAGSFYFGGWCYDTCPTQAQYFTDNSCVASCPTGSKLIDGVCANIV